jgi:hypothetical protein
VSLYLTFERCAMVTDISGHQAEGLYTRLPGEERLSGGGTTLQHGSWARG